MTFYIQEHDGSFIEAGYKFKGFPSNGIWIVEDGSRNCIRPMKGVPKMPSPALISYLQYEQELSEYIQKNKGESLSISSISKLACEFFALKAGGMKVLDEIIEY